MGDKCRWPLDDIFHIVVVSEPSKHTRSKYRYVNKHPQIQIRIDGLIEGDWPYAGVDLDGILDITIVLHTSARTTRQAQDFVKGAENYFVASDKLPYRIIMFYYCAEEGTLMRKIAAHSNNDSWPGSSAIGQEREIQPHYTLFYKHIWH